MGRLGRVVTRSVPKQFRGCLQILSMSRYEELQVGSYVDDVVVAVRSVAQEFCVASRNCLACPLH